MYVCVCRCACVCIASANVMITVKQSLCNQLVSEIHVSKNYGILLSKINVNSVAIL